MSWMSLYGLVGHSQMLADRSAVQSLIPNQASVAADVYLLPQIVDRTTVQVAHPSWKDETGIPIRAEWVFLDRQSRAFFNHTTSPWVGSLIDQLTEGQYEVVAERGRYVLLLRTK